MLEAFTSIPRLRWTNPPQLRPLPDNITRTFISTPSKPDDKLEIIVTNNPSKSTSTTNTTTTASSKPSPPILFLHGGFGNAGVWIPFMTHLAQTTKHQCFALSLRNHGGSYTVPFLRMVYGTTIADLAIDAVAAVEHIRSTTGQTPILVGHSSGGGMAQYLLAHKLISKSNNGKTPALVLLDAVPHLGNFPVYANWARHDPWFMLRLLVQLYHPISPLSSINLVRGAFFGSGTTTTKNTRRDPMTDDQVAEFERWMPRYESLWWPMEMMGGFWAWMTGKPRWLDVKDILAGMSFDNNHHDSNEANDGGDRVCIMVGDEDVLMDVGLCRRAAEEYREGIEALRRDKKIDATPTASAPTSTAAGVANEGEKQKVEQVDGTLTESRGGVQLVVVHGAGHHAQNDIQWEVAADALRRFLSQI